MPHIDLNADLGEGQSAELDAALIRLLSSVNVACGGHAGDESSMRRIVKASDEAGARVGAHPSYPDIENFGRVSVSIEYAELTESLTQQISSLISVADSEGIRVEYVKPHGSLYNDAAVSKGIAAVIFEVADHLSLKVMALSGSLMASMRPEQVITEGFIDRRYQDDGTLVPRTERNALILDPVNAANQALALAPKVASLCVHSDTPNAVVLLKAAREALEREGYEIAAR